MIVSIIIPAYNEVTTIEDVLEQVQAVDLEKEIVIVDDFSTDGTREKLEALKKIHPIKVFHHDVNMGKGAALRTGFKEATGDIVIVQDADLEYDPQEIPIVVKPIKEGRADVVFGSRFAGGECHRVLFYWHSLGNRFLTMLSNMMTNLNLTDMEVCYKAFRREIFDVVTIEENRFGFEPEITAKVSKLNYRIYEVGISYDGRTYDEGKKIGWRDGVRAIWCILKYNLFN
jgi:glycosyltransferase involved in cell wall biosynthesis